MAVAFDAVGPGSTGAIYNNTTSASYTHPGGASDDGMAICFGYFTSTGQVTSVDVGGAAASHVIDVYGSVGAEIWGLKDLAGAGKQGSQTITINFAGATNCFGWCGSVSVTGSDTTTLFSNTASDSNTSSSPSAICTSATGELVVDAMWFDSNPGQVPTSSNTLRWSSGGSTAGASVNAASSTAPGAATVTMGYTLSGSHGWIVCAASFKAAGAAAAKLVAPYIVRQAVKRASYF